MKFVLLRISLILSTVLVNSSLAASDCSYSKIWGKSGETWKAENTLPDFSYAGYHAGEDPLPEEKARWNFKKDFGGKGDGVSDDTKAFQKALRTVSNGVLYFPEGKYVLSKKIEIQKGHIVFRGAGVGKTIWLLSKSLSDLYGYKVQKFHNFSEWSFGPGLINVIGPEPITSETLIAKIIAPQERGAKSLLLVKAPKGLKVGQWVRLVESDPPLAKSTTGSLIQSLYAGTSGDSASLHGTKNVVRFLSRIEAIHKLNGKTEVQLQRPLPYDVKLEWSPELHLFSPQVEEVGFEDLSLQFPWTSYPGHFKERGYNALSFKSAAHCWVKNIEIVNSDFGLAFQGTDFCSATGVTVKTSQSRNTEPASEGVHGHHAIDVSYGTENLITNFKIQEKFHHDLSVEWYALHTVFSNGSGSDLNMDHHREANYSSLFTNLDCGLCTRPFESSGVKGRGFHAGAYTTFWNIHGTIQPLPIPPADFGPALNFIGAFANQEEKALNWYREDINAKSLCPSDLHAAMVTKKKN